MTVSSPDIADTRTLAQGRQPWFATGLALAAVGFVLYPAIRPFSDETSLDGAAAFASPSWVVAHSIAIVAFVLLALGLYGLSLRLQVTRGARRSRGAVALGWLGVGLTLPYYGAEVFGLHAAGRVALDQHDASLLDTLTSAIRWQTGIWFIVTGLLLLAAAGVVVATAVWPTRTGAGRWAGVPLAIALVLYLPQFTGTQAVRVAHGVLMAVGCTWLALVVLKPAGAEEPGVGR